MDFLLPWGVLGLMGLAALVMIARLTQPRVPRRQPEAITFSLREERILQWQKRMSLLGSIPFIIWLLCGAAGLPLGAVPLRWLPQLGLLVSMGYTGLTEMVFQVGYDSAGRMGPRWPSRGRQFVGSGCLGLLFALLLSPEIWLNLILLGVQLFWWVWARI